MTITLLGYEFTINPMDRLGVHWMFESLLEGKPSFRSFKTHLEGEVVYIFTRHQEHLNEPQPCLFIMGKGWSEPVVLKDKREWLECYMHMQKLEKTLNARKESIVL